MTPSGPAPRVRRGDAQLFLNAAGRAGRLTYVAALVPVVLLVRLPDIAPEGGAHAVLAALLWPAAGVAAAVLTSKRLHDLGLAGWWTAPLAALIYVATHAPAEGFFATAGSWGVVICLGLLVGWPGQPVFNRFGPRPEAFWRAPPD